MLCLYLSGIALAGRILQASKYGFPLKMELAEAKVAKTRAAHEKAVGKLKKLYDIRKGQRQEQLLKAMMSARRSFEEILKFISDDTAFQCGSIFAF